MKGVTIPIFKHTDDTKIARDLDLNYNYADCKEDEIIFYHIVGISKEIDGDNEYTCIHTACGEYISPLKIDEVADLIKDL